jgi:peptidyl-tRNA hydrolase
MNTRHNAGYFALDMLRICLRYEGFMSKPKLIHSFTMINICNQIFEV